MIYHIAILYSFIFTIQYLTVFFRTEPWSHNIELFDCLSNLLQSRKPTTTCKLLQKHRKPEIITRNMPKLGTKSHFLGHPLLGWDFWYRETHFFVISRKDKSFFKNSGTKNCPIFLSFGEAPPLEPHNDLALKSALRTSHIHITRN